MGRVDTLPPKKNTMRLCPRVYEAGVIFASTTRARPVTCGERGVLIQKEELGVSPGSHDDSLAAVEGTIVVALDGALSCHVKLTREPRGDFEWSRHLASGIVQDAAVAERGGGRRVATRHRNQIAPRRHAVLQRAGSGFRRGGGR